jgi:alcohol dehydrogenase class IV
MWEDSIDINAISEVRSKSIVYIGVNAIVKIADITMALKSQGISNILVVTGASSYLKSGAWEPVKDSFKKHDITYELYCGVTPNPTTDQVDAAVAVGKKLKAQAVLGIGGGSSIDAAKSAAILLMYPEKKARELYEGKFTPDKALPIVAINLTHGTGTEIDRIAVVSIPENQFKPAIAFECIYPQFSINDPALMTSLPVDQTRYVSLDALNHAVEAATTKTATHYSILLAAETTRLVAKYLPIALKNPLDLKARYFLTYAAMLAGLSFDNGLLHFTHALEHPLSGVNPDVIHGLGVAILLPSVIRQIYPAKSKVLAGILSPIVPGLHGSADETEIEKAIAGVKKWLQGVGVPLGLKSIGFSETDIPLLTKLAMTTPSLGLLLSLAPVDSHEKAIEKIYRESFKDDSI